MAFTGKFVNLSIYIYIYIYIYINEKKIYLLPLLPASRGSNVMIF